MKILAISLLSATLLAATIAVEPANALDRRCWHGKPPIARNASHNTGTHGPGDNAYYKRSGYFTKCGRSQKYGVATKWASNCSKYFSKYFKAKYSSYFENKCR